MPPIQQLDNHRVDTAGQIAELLRAAYTLEATLLGVSDFPPLRRTRTDIQASANQFRGWRRLGRLQGVIELEQPSSALPWLIASLGVDPDCHRNGIASALVQSVLTQARQPVQVSTAALNAPAVALYRKLGFKLSGHQETPEGIALVHFEWRP